MLTAWTIKLTIFNSFFGDCLLLFYLLSLTENGNQLILPLKMLYLALKPKYSGVVPVVEEPPVRK